MQRNKVLSAIASVLIAFCMWLYVITVDSPDYRDTIYDIPLTLVGETALRSRNLVLTDISSDTVDITFSGNRSDVLKLNKSNITLKVDLSRIYDPGVQTVEWTTAYPGDVANNAFTQESRDPDKVTVTIENWVRKEIPVRVAFTGSVPIGVFADTENVVREFTTITIAGPESVIENVEEALIRIDLSEHRESVSEFYRYTLVNKDEEPVDAAMIEVNVEEVRIDLTVQTVKDVALVINLVDGGGATAETTVLDYSPRSIKFVGDEAVLAALDEIVLGTLNLAEELEAREIRFEIPEIEGVTNLSGLTEVTGTISFPSLSMKDVVLENLTAINVPEGMEAEIITQKLTIKIRGPYGEVMRLTPEDIRAEVDFTGAQIGSSTFRVVITFGDTFQTLGVVGTCSASATVTEVEEQE